jgi:ATP-binding cassette subfamily F protein 3
VAKSFERPLFSDVSVDIHRGQRWALLGPNGCGKTTLLRCLLGFTPPDQGKIKLGTGVMVGYFDQQLAELDDQLAVVDAIRPKQQQLNEQQRRDLLAGFGLTGDRALQPVGSLSGGERCRAALARLAAAEANFLVLDEPTNHLDLWARDALENALLRFHGTVLFVSHDRYFVNRVADHVLAIEPGRAFSMEGNYDSYQARSNRPAGDGPDGEAAGQPETQPDKPAKQSKPTAKKRHFPYRKVADLEHEIFERESCIASLQSELTQPEVLRDGERVREVKLQIEREQATLKGLYEHWEEATELNW